MSHHDDTNVQLTELRQQIVAMANSVDEIKSTLRTITVLDRTVAELTIRNEQYRANINTQWERIDKNYAEIERVDKKADEWINKGRGAWFAIMIFGAIGQALVLSCVAYTFSHLRSAEDTILVMEQKLIRHEAYITREKNEKN